MATFSRETLNIAKGYVYGVLSASTAHIRQSTNNELRASGWDEFHGAGVSVIDGGFRVSVDADGSVAPRLALVGFGDLGRLYLLAQTLGVCYLDIESDGNIIPGLDVYDW